MDSKLWYQISHDWKTSVNGFKFNDNENDFKNKEGGIKMCTFIFL